MIVPVHVSAPVSREPCFHPQSQQRPPGQAAVLAPPPPARRAHDCCRQIHLPVPPSLPFLSLPWSPRPGEGRTIHPPRLAATSSAAPPNQQAICTARISPCHFDEDPSDHVLSVSTSKAPVRLHTASHLCAQTRRCNSPLPKISTPQPQAAQPLPFRLFVSPSHPHFPT
jgi:hypothetical protein